MSAAPFNKNIENWLSSVPYLEIDEAFAISALANYMAEIALISAGVPFSELGFSDRRASLLPSVLPFSASSFITAQNLTGSSVPQNSIALLKLSGVMRSQDGISNYGADTFSGWLRAAYANPNIDGVIVETESGGGEVLAGTKIDNALSERNKPVVAFSHMAASAAYRAVSNADEIIGAGPGSIFGSIGAMYEVDKKRLAALKEQYDIITGTNSPNKNADHIKAMNGDYSGLQKMADMFTNEFHDQIKKSRPLSGNVKETLSGAMFGAKDAKSRGLIDSIGNMQYAVKRVRALKSKFK